MQNNLQAALQHYGSWEHLLKMIDDKLSFYLQIPQIVKLMEDGGLRPEYVLNEASPACFSDAIALRCLNSYDEKEADNDALERCMAMQLHENFTQMEKADLEKVSFGGNTWEQYTVDALLRLGWRLRGRELEIPIYLTRCGQSELSKEFTLTLSAETVVLINCTKNRAYELTVDGAWSFADFSQELRRCFRLATEEDGYFVPDFVWLCSDGGTK